ncbi:MAG: hypothetical protein M3H12_11710, partial [Chromatiales bacterium]
ELQSLAKREETIYGDYQPSLRSPWLAAIEKNESALFKIHLQLGTMVDAIVHITGHRAILMTLAGMLW